MQTSNKNNTMLQQLSKKLNSRQAGVDKDDMLWDAAVLMPLVEVEGQLCVLFEQRAQNMRRQPGEICFPGGHVDSKDASFAITALRETCEEIGICQDRIKIIGELDALVTHSGPIIHPFVGFLDNMDNIKLSSNEVERVFTVPLKFFLTANPRIGHVQLADKPQEDFPFELVPQRLKNWRYHKDYKVYFYNYEGTIIWGMTARILHSFLEHYRNILETIY